MAPRGTPVLAAAGGTVEKLFESERGGHTLYVRSPDGRWIYYYAHLDAYAPGVREGRRCAPGEPIGYVGDTGNAGRGRSAPPFRGQADGSRASAGAQGTHGQSLSAACRTELRVPRALRPRASLFPDRRFSP